MTTLRQVLALFEQHQRPLLVTEIVHAMNISEAMATEMIQFWVRKGKLGEMEPNCGCCAGKCPLADKLPCSYKLI